jgi:DNA-binding HxlR family transcriptional regulator
LSARLKELEARGLVERRVETGPPVKVSYELTKHGRAFHDVSKALVEWGRELTKPAGRARQR